MKNKLIVDLKMNEETTKNKVSFASEKDAIAISKQDAIRFGEKMSLKLKYEFSFNSLQEVVKKLGGVIDYDHSLNINNFTQSGSLTIENEKKFIILLDPLATYMRNNFTLAHELGHYYFHYIFSKKNNNLKFYRRDSNILEWQANWFASGFLMPEKEFKDKINKYPHNDKLVAMSFDVSIEAVKYRLNTINNS